MIYDLVIIGGGPAGMSAALYAKRQNLKFLFIAKQLGGLANYVPTLKAYLGYRYITGFDLVERFKEHLAEHKVPLVQENVAKLERRTGTFIVSTDTDTYRARSIIIATGRRFKKLGIPGEADYLGKGLSECTVCDGPLFKGKTVAVIGGGRSGLFGTLFLLELAKKIYLIEQGPHLKTEGGLAWAAEKIRTAANVELMPNTKPLAVEGNRFVQRLLLSRKGRKSHLPVDGVFVEIGYVPNTEFVGSLVKRNARGEIIVDEECRTSVPGIFAAGDVTHLKEKQVVVSVGDGAKAALSAVLYLEGLKK